MKTLFLYLRDFSCEETEEEITYSGTLGWFIQGEDGTEAEEGECHVLDLKAALEQYDDGTRFNSTVLFLDDSYTLFIREQVPGRTVAQIRRALPFAVENYLSNDIENTHIAHGPISRGNATDCIAIDNEMINQILQALKISEVYPTLCTTMGMQISRPEEVHDVSLLLDDTNAWVRTTEQLAQVNLEALPDVMASISGHRDPVPTIRIWHFGSNDNTDFFDTSMYEQEEFDNRERSLLSFAVEQFEPGKSVNLLQGQYSAKENATVNVRRWIMTGVFGLVCLYAYIALQASEGIWASFNVNSVQNKMKAQYVEIYEEEPRGRDIAQQMRARLGVAENTTREFDMLIERLADIVSSASHSPVINFIRYEALRNSLVVEYEISDHEAMESFIQSLATDSIEVQRGSATARGDVLRANLTLKISI